MSTPYPGKITIEASQERQEAWLVLCAWFVARCMAGKLLLPKCSNHTVLGKILLSQRLLWAAEKR